MKKFKLLSFTLALGLLCFAPLVAKASFTDYGTRETFVKNGVYVLGYTGSNDGYASVGIYGIKNNRRYTLGYNASSSWAQTGTIFIGSLEYTRSFSEHYCNTDSAITEIR